MAPAAPVTATLIGFFSAATAAVEANRRASRREAIAISSNVHLGNKGSGSNPRGRGSLITRRRTTQVVGRVDGYDQRG